MVRNLHLLGLDVVEDPIVLDQQPVLRSLESSQPLDTAPADLLRLMPEVLRDHIADRGPVAGTEAAEIAGGVGGKDVS
jgi:hypothetical protein